MGEKMIGFGNVGFVMSVTLIPFGMLFMMATDEFAGRQFLKFGLDSFNLSINIFVFS